MENFDAVLSGWLADAQKQIDQNYARMFPNLTPCKLTVDPGGQKYLRIVKTSDGGKGQRSVFCFVEKATGNVLKAASWKAPAKGVRGNIADPAARSCSAYGAHYLR